MLNLYTEIRATFGSLPEVIDNLVSIFITKYNKFNCTTIS